MWGVGSVCVVYRLVVAFSFLRRGSSAGYGSSAVCGSDALCVSSSACGSRFWCHPPLLLFSSLLISRVVLFTFSYSSGEGPLEVGVTWTPSAHNRVLSLDS